MHATSGFPTFESPVTDAERREMDAFPAELVLVHRHEGTLLNNRLQGFIVATSLLVAAYAQFREPRYLPAAIVVCAAALALSAITEHILGRTSRAIEWHITVIRDLERALTPNENMRPYDTRRTMTRRHSLGVSRILGRGLPRGTLLMWIAPVVIAAVRRASAGEVAGLRWGRWLRHAERIASSACMAASARPRRSRLPGWCGHELAPEGWGSGMTTAPLRS